MRFSTLLDALPPALRPARGAPGDPVIRGICYDSRRVAPGDLFVALSGANADGHAYVGQALRLGAAALLLEREVAEAGDTPCALVADTRRALAPLATHFFGAPARELALVGVTGTNGKTSTTFLLESILAAAGHQVGLIGTVEIRYAGEHQRAINTTPESLDLQRCLRDMRTHGVDAAVMEVSSHGLALGRVAGCEFAAAAITNLTQDHLDFHASMEAYRDAKALLFREHLRAGAPAVVNADDPAAPHFERAAREAGARLVRVSRDAERPAELRVLSADVGLDGTRARLGWQGAALELASPLVGDFNVENLAIAVGVALGLGIAPDAIARGVAACPQVPGRVERVVAGGERAPTVLVDYAHTPDAVEKLLRTLRPLTKRRLIALFGCGGDRDRGKRPLMAQAVARYADLALLTSDNPRTEDPEAILSDVEPGLAGLPRVAPEALAGSERGYARVADRARAIDLAVALARPGDIAVLAGKGHEDYQIVGREKLPFDDREHAARALRRHHAS